MSYDIISLIAVVVATLIGGLGWVLRSCASKRDGGAVSQNAPPAQHPPEPTTYDDEDDHATDVAAADTDASPDLDAAVDDVLADLRARREDR